MEDLTNYDKSLLIESNNDLICTKKPKKYRFEVNIDLNVRFRKYHTCVCATQTVQSIFLRILHALCRFVLVLEFRSFPNEWVNQLRSN